MVSKIYKGLLKLNKKNTNNPITEWAKDPNRYLTKGNISSVQSSSRIPLFETPWTAAHQASLSITSSRNLPKFMSIELVMPSNHLILCHPLLLPSVFPRIRVFPMSQLFTSGCQSIRASTSASVLPVSIHGWFPLGLIGLISLLSSGLSRVLSRFL